MSIPLPINTMANTESVKTIPLRLMQLLDLLPDAPIEAYQLAYEMSGPLLELRPRKNPDLERHIGIFITGEAPTLGREAYLNQYFAPSLLTKDACDALTETMAASKCKESYRRGIIIDQIRELLIQACIVFMGLRKS
jgi:hypothetical protein